MPAVNDGRLPRQEGDEDEAHARDGGQDADRQKHREPAPDRDTFQDLVHALPFTFDPP